MTALDDLDVHVAPLGEEGRALFKTRVAPDIFARNIYDRAIVDVLVKSKGHVKSKIW